MLRANLKLEEPFEIEEDIAEASSYLGIVLTPASSTSSSTEGSLTTPTPTRPTFPQGFNVPHIPPSISRKKSLGKLNSPSSPSLPKFPRPATLSRSKTLPRVFQLESKPRRRQAELDQLDLTPETVEKLRRWIIGIAIVDFDVDDGPVIDGIYPPSILLPVEAENLAFSSFPDSLQFDQGSQSHSFRVREQLGSMHAEKRPPTKDGFIYGYSHFTQKRVSTSKRGYEQRSVVILTQHQFPAFFSLLISIFGPLFQQHGLLMLETACQNIATWRDPAPGETLELGFLGSVLRLVIPLTMDEQQFTPSQSTVGRYDPRQHIAASASPLLPPPILLFEASLSQLWSIWECLVLCEPLFVFGASPAQTSQAIWWLRDLLRPIPFAGDFRPYFTMQDEDHSLLVNRLPPKPGVLLGVTNPFFEKSCDHWPHILSLGCRRSGTSTAQKSISSSPAGPVPGWKSKKHKRYISKDRVLLRQLETALHSDERTKLNASLALRRHFHSRTTELVTPLARYLNTLIPSPTEVARSSAHTLRLKPFSSANFFASLKAHGSTLPFRSTSKRTEFYERLLKTPGFGLWLAQQEQIVEGVLKEKRTA
ncbi:hypothetical protein D9615_005688 [Tricholomella constricta]|uniref:UDENN domain-containing protein n=1 Tax=Tricholomella constricta TaxID=117010 RepID=A0A8H5M3X5_9AGAR|nr:hypothetical protein D9615_005688 [Tricholomella constricta]